MISSVNSVLKRRGASSWRVMNHIFPNNITNMQYGKFPNTNPSIDIDEGTKHRPGRDTETEERDGRLCSEKSVKRYRRRGGDKGMETGGEGSQWKVHRLFSVHFRSAFSYLQLDGPSIRYTSAKTPPTSALIATATVVKTDDGLRARAPLSLPPPPLEPDPDDDASELML